MHKDTLFFIYIFFFYNFFCDFFQQLSFSRRCGRGIREGSGGHPQGTPSALFSDLVGPGAEGDRSESGGDPEGKTLYG